MALNAPNNPSPRKVSLDRGFRAIFLRSVIQIVRRPLMWIGFLGLPLFLFLFFPSMMDEGLPTRIPAAIVDRDGTQLSRQITQMLGGMQMVEIAQTPQSYTEARHAMQRGEIYGFFLIPEEFQADLLAGRSPSISFYTNTTFFVPASLLFKTFKATAVYTKAGVAVDVVQSVGVDPQTASPLLQPINIQSRGIGNPTLNYGIYLANSFIPCALQLMILLMTVFSLGQEIKYATSRRLLRMADGSIVKALFAKLLPQTIIWMVLALFMAVWLFKYNHYTMQGSWGWIILSELMFVLACQGMALFIFGLLPNLRLSLSASALLGILTFSLAAFSFPEQSMYTAISPLAWLTPVRYNFLIYSDIALNGNPVYYARVWFAVYIVYMIIPFTDMYRIRREFREAVYVP
ncbi:MAG: ABC transporter permease [Bacteroides sp.]|nr:ABC transporter permease [Bacteroides sp.]